MNPDSYYQRSEVSNSDLSKLKQVLYPRDMPDPTQAYRFGNLIDAMITEPERVDYFQKCCDNDVFSDSDWRIAERMKAAFWSDSLCENLMKGVETQKVMVKRRALSFKGYDFELDVRCKWDGWRPDLGYGFDIKSTSAQTQNEFETAARYFDYPRQRSWYMDIAESNFDVLIGISKKNFKVFKIAIKRGDSFYREGYEDYINLAFRYHILRAE